MHKVDHFEYYEHVDREKVQYELNQIAESETCYPKEEGIDILKPITWYDNIVCEDKDSAIDLIWDLEGGEIFRQSAVKYKEYVPGKKSKKQLEKEKQSKKLFDEVFALDNKKISEYYPSEDIPCEQCGSSLNAHYLDSNYCPVCGYDLRDDDAINEINKKKIKLLRIQDQIAELERKRNEEFILKWVVKIDFPV